MMLQRGIRACFTTNKSLNVYGTVSRSFSITSSVSAFKRPSRFKPIKEELKIEEKEDTKQEIKQKTQNSSSISSPKLVKSNQSDKSSISELIDQKVNAKLNEEKSKKTLKFQNLSIIQTIKKQKRMHQKYLKMTRRTSIPSITNQKWI